MANQEHLDILNQGVDVWNRWREKHYELVPDLYGIDLSWRNLSGANLCQTDLGWTNLSYAQLEKANLSYAGLVRTNLIEANLSEANLSNATGNGAFLEGATLKNAILIRTNLSKADLSGADLSGADLGEANLFEANLSGTQLSGAKLERASLARAILDSTTLTGATLTHCLVYGVSAWNVQLAGATQLNLVITLPDEPTITVDNLEVAQFIYLLLNNTKIRDVIDTIAKKAVLILGRFTPERKAILNGLREALHTYGYIPILFDFDKPSSRDLTETVSILAHLSKFVIVDLTHPNSVPYELGTLVHQCIVPFQPILLEDQHEFAMLQDIRRRHDWLLPTHSYRELEDLLASLQTKVIEPAEQKAEELEKR